MTMTATTTLPTTAAGMLAPPRPVFRNPCALPPAHLDNQQLSERFWEAVKLDSPTSPTFSDVDPFPAIDAKAITTIHIEEVSPSLIDDPIVAFETWDCYSPDRPTFSPATTDCYAHATDPAYQPCPFGEPLGFYTSPAPTLASIRYRENAKPAAIGRAASTPLRATTRLQKRSPSFTRHPQGPSTVLALASAFLDSIVRLTRSRASTPTTFNDHIGSVTILESEVVIDVLDDATKRGAVSGQVEQGSAHAESGLSSWSTVVAAAGGSGTVPLQDSGFDRIDLGVLGSLRPDRLQLGAGACYAEQMQRGRDVFRCPM